MLFSLVITTLVGVSASAILTAYEKYIEIKERKTQEINETSGRDLQQTETLESPPLADAHTDSQCVNENKNENKNENDNDNTDNINSFKELPSIIKSSTTDVTSKNEMLPISKLSSSIHNEDERLNNLDDKLDELINRVRMLREYKEQQMRKGYQQQH
ncbi:hypothetical protein Glove_552g15 [Diversispora epigaea]|uniref:Uncharacterized protein n=1 Tax=Diversispora epigaea TaxID=1348612 RepID=A0A397GBG1_9GLOM|nr:hypothetical protein Glove_552g15 [Diversispora epigaea]